MVYRASSSRGGWKIFGHFRTKRSSNFFALKSLISKNFHCQNPVHIAVLQNLVLLLFAPPSSKKEWFHEPNWYWEKFKNNKKTSSSCIEDATNNGQLKQKRWCSGWGLNPRTRGIRTWTERVWPLHYHCFVDLVVWTAIIKCPFFLGFVKKQPERAQSNTISRVLMSQSVHIRWQVRGFKPHPLHRLFEWLSVSFFVRSCCLPVVK